MKKILAAVAVLVAVILAYSFTSRSSGSKIQTIPGSQMQSQSTAPQKFSDQPYYSRSYLISAGTLSPQAQAALAGFQLSKNAQSDGGAVITLKALQTQYSDQQYTLKPGEQLYFVEKTLSDDPGGNEINIADDTAVVVDANGIVVQAPVNFQ